jgi:hypothetical protein
MRYIMKFGKVNDGIVNIALKYVFAYLENISRKIIVKLSKESY